MVYSESKYCCQVDFILLQSLPDRDYKFIMVYQNHLSKFVVIQTLIFNTAEVAYYLLEIFILFRAPLILQSDNGRKFANKMINNLK